MQPRLHPHALVLLVAMLLISGCGGPKQVTYVDPNGASAGINAMDVTMPVADFGAAAMERAKAIVRLRGALMTARSLAASDSEGAAEVIDRAIRDDLPLVEARASRSDPQLALTLRSGFEELRDTAPAAAVYARKARQLSDRYLAQVEQLVIPAKAREDTGFRVVVLYETLLQAASSYEAAMDGGSSLVEVDDYHEAYGLMTVVTTRLLDTVPPTQRPQARSKLMQLSRRVFPGPTVQGQPRDSEGVVNEVTTMADDLITALGVDPTYPEPHAATADRLRSFKRAVASLVESGARGSHRDALRQIQDADDLLLEAADGLALVAPELLAQLEEALLITLPLELDAGNAVPEAAADLDALVDEAIVLVEEELELLRES